VNMKFKSILSAAALVTIAASAAHAVPLFPGLTLLEDDNREYLIKGANNTVPALAGTLQVGDRLRGVIEFGKIEQIFGGGSVNPIVPELTGIFDTEVKFIQPILDLGGNPTGLGNIVWGPTSSFMGNGVAGTAMVALYTGGTNLDLNSCASIATCETAASDGSLWAVAGFGDADDQWISANSVLDFGAVSGIGASTKVAAVNYALSILVNNTGYTFNEVKLDCFPLGPFNCAGPGKDKLTDLVGSGDVLGGEGLTNGFGARSDIDVKVNVVPEPGSLALLSLALAGLGFVTRRRSV